MPIINLLDDATVGPTGVAGIDQIQKNVNITVFFSSLEINRFYNL